MKILAYKKATIICYGSPIKVCFNAHNVKSTSNSLQSQLQTHFKVNFKVNFKLTSNSLQTHFKLTSNSLQTRFKLTSNSLQTHFKLMVTLSFSIYLTTYLYILASAFLTLS